MGQRAEAAIAARAHCLLQQRQHLAVGEADVRKRGLQACRRTRRRQEAEGPVCLPGLRQLPGGCRCMVFQPSQLIQAVKRHAWINPSNLLRVLPLEWNKQQVGLCAKPRELKARHTGSPAKLTWRISACSLVSLAYTVCGIGSDGASNSSDTSPLPAVLREKSKGSGGGGPSREGG